MSSVETSINANITDIINHSNSVVINGIHELNDDFYEGYQWIAALDRTTCLACAALDNKIFDKLPGMPGEGTEPPDEPPLHHNCRCIIVPVLEGMRDDPSQTKVNYQDWFDRQEKGTQLDILGPARYKEYLNGKAVTAFARDGRITTLKELGVSRIKRSTLIKTNIFEGETIKELIKIQGDLPSYLEKVTEENWEKILVMVKNGETGNIDKVVITEKGIINKNGDIIIPKNILMAIDEKLNLLPSKTGKIINIIVSDDQTEKLNNPGILVTNEKELQQGLKNFKEHIENMEEPYKSVYSKYAETTILKKEPLRIVVIGYDPDDDVIAYNKRLFEIKMKSQPQYANIIYSHELAHRYDHLKVKSWENKIFVNAIEEAIKKIKNDLDKYKDLYNKIKDKNPAFDDILSALSDNKIKVSYNHENTYWNISNNKAIEIFADMSYIQANHIKLPEFDGLLDDIIEIAKTMFIKGAK